MIFKHIYIYKAYININMYSSSGLSKWPFRTSCFQVKHIYSSETGKEMSIQWLTRLTPAGARSCCPPNVDVADPGTVLWHPFSMHGAIWVSEKEYSVVSQSHQQLCLLPLRHLLDHPSLSIWHALDKCQIIFWCTLSISFTWWMSDFPSHIISEDPNMVHRFRNLQPSNRIKLVT